MVGWLRSFGTYLEQAVMSLHVTLSRIHYRPLHLGMVYGGLFGVRGGGFVSFATLGVDHQYHP